MVGCILQVLSVLLAANLIISEDKPYVPLPVHGVINQSMDLTLDVTGIIQEIYWTYKTYILAHITNNHLNIKNEDFANRLETLNSSTILRITNLRKEDGGIYTVSVHFILKKIYKTSYSLTVYDPVPSPDIRTEVKEDTTDRCNVTLHCSVPSNTSDFSYTWKYRHRDPGYQRYNNGSSIQISVRPDHQDMELLCIVHNPADQKSVSSNVRHICPHLVALNRNNGGKGRHYYMLHILLTCGLVSLVMVLGWFLYKRIKIREKAKERRRQELKGEEKEEETQYAELTLQPQSRGTENTEPRVGEGESVVYSAVIHQHT